MLSYSISISDLLLPFNVIVLVCIRTVALYRSTARSSGHLLTSLVGGMTLPPDTDSQLTTYLPDLPFLSIKLPKHQQH